MFFSVACITHCNVPAKFGLDNYNTISLELYQCPIGHWRPAYVFSCELVCEYILEHGGSADSYSIHVYDIIKTRWSVRRV